MKLPSSSINPEIALLSDDDRQLSRRERGLPEDACIALLPYPPCDKGKESVEALLVDA